MEYSFEIVGVTPVLTFFNQQQASRDRRIGAEYLGAYHCTLDAFIESIETIPPRRNWQLDRMVDTVINFWLNNAEPIRLWKQRLENAGGHNILVARVADLNALRMEFESLFGEPS